MKDSKANSFLGMVLLFIAIILIIYSFQPVGASLLILLSGSAPKDTTGITAIISMLTMGLIPLLLGIGMLIGAIKLLRTKSKNKKYMNDLTKTGNKVIANITRVVMNDGYMIMGKHPYNIYCTYKDPYSNIEYEFMSENIWDNINIGDIKEIPVYVDKNDKSNYYVDVKSINLKENKYTIKL